jgi:conjugative transfer region protein TrbK
MSRYFTLRLIAWIAAAGFIVLTGALAVIRSPRSEDAGVIAPLMREEALGSELTRCRAVTSDQIALLENCRRVWAENRRQFFGPIRTTPSAGPLPIAATASGKDQHRNFPVEAEHQQSEIR